MNIITICGIEYYKTIGDRGLCIGCELQDKNNDCMNPGNSVCIDENIIYKKVENKMTVKARLDGIKAYKEGVPCPLNVNVNKDKYWLSYVQGWKQAEEEDLIIAIWRHNTTQEMQEVIKSFEKTGKIRVLHYGSKEFGVINNPAWDFTTNFYKPFIEPEKDIFVNVYLKNNKSFDIQKMYQGIEADMNLFFHQNKERAKTSVEASNGKGQTFKLTKV